MPYYTIFTTKEVDIIEIRSILERKLGCSLRLRRRSFNEVAKNNYIRALRYGEPHDLLGYFPELVNLRRWAIIGRKKL